jgi:putative transposase
MISDTKLMHEGASTRELCRLLRVSRATTYRRQMPKQIPVPLTVHCAATPESKPIKIKSQPLNEENIFLHDEIEQLVLKHPWHGYRRITKLLARKGIHVNRKRVLRIMQLEKLICKRKKRFVPKTTDSNHAYRCYPNLLEKHKPQGLDEVWHADLTYIRVKESFVYLACVLDGFSRKIVGYAISIFMDSMLVLEALQMALKSRSPAPGLIHHSDRGSQYASERYIRMLEKHDVQISMSRVGMATDNAKIESFFGGFKRECVNLLEFDSLADVLANIPAFLEGVYNEKRLHSSLGYLPPVEFEALVRSESESATVTVRL